MIKTVVYQVIRKLNISGKYADLKISDRKRKRFWLLWSYDPNELMRSLRAFLQEEYTYTTCISHRYQFEHYFKTFEKIFDLLSEYFVDGLQLVHMTVKRTVYIYGSKYFYNWFTEEKQIMISYQIIVVLYILIM